MPEAKKILVTGATGKVGQALIRRLLSEPAHAATDVRALCHQRVLDAEDRLEIVLGSVEDRATVEEVLRGVTHVVHLATCKETPSRVMDVVVKGLFWLLEVCRTSPTFRQFILIGGDASVGHYYYPHPVPVTELQRHTAYPGCYSLSKVLEEVMLEQYRIQYGLNSCCLRAPWIMEKDDLRSHLTFGETSFGGPRWRDLVGPARADELLSAEAIPVLLDPSGRPVRRSFVHVEDLVSAILLALDHPAARGQTFHIGMDEPVDYGEMGRYLTETRGLPTADVPSAHFSTWLDNAKAKFLLDWRPAFDMRSLVDASWSYERPADEPRRVWYPG
ncbi:MAG: NAD(P)-dependent oxidoreductase [Candidatus Bipolaricaulota bacterium]